ncbi:MAG: YkgJ family cysteine cluster protein, partial [Methanothrix sp.]
VRVDDSGKRIVLDFPVLKSKADTTCVFFNNGCTIYSIRPKACRLFPFRVEEETTPLGDIILNISCNRSCPGTGNGKIADKKLLEKLVSDQFQERSEAIATEVRILAQDGKISSDARIYRSHPGRRTQSKST